jgi:hypothetical protein
MQRFSNRELTNQKIKKDNAFAEAQNAKFLKQHCVLINGKYYYQSEFQKTLTTLIKKYA